MPELASTGVQLETPTHGVVLGAGQVVVVQLLPDVGPDAVQDTTGTLLVVFVLQVVVVQLLPDVGDAPEQLCTGTLVVVPVLQVTVA